MKNKSKIFIFIGPPGSGKGTQAEMLAKKLKTPTISVGDLFRREVKKKTKIGKTVQAIMASGALVPDGVVIDILKNRLKKKDTAKGFIFDGFPRTGEQLEYLKNNLPSFLEKTSVFYVRISDVEVRERLGGRRVCVCGSTYHLKYNPPKKNNICDSCGKKLFVREDDKIKAINARLKIFHKVNNPLLRRFSADKVLFKINGGQPIKKVQEDILKSLKKI